LIGVDVAREQNANIGLLVAEFSIFLTNQPSPVTAAALTEKGDGFAAPHSWVCLRTRFGHGF
ncbi:MAG: hypothetical protein WB774_07615, partial [Xanthobacteraceae bacterium]